MSPSMRCKCGNEIALSGKNAYELRCPSCGRRPSISVALVSAEAGKFATLLIVLSLITAAPAIWVMVEALTRPRTDAVPAAVPVWAYVTIFAAFVLIGYSVYLLQFPHWASLQTVALVSLVCGVAAALIFGGTLVGSASGWAGTLLQLGDLLPTARGPNVTSTSLWCLLLTAAWTGLSMWCGWRAYIVRAQARRIYERA